MHHASRLPTDGGTVPPMSTLVVRGGNPLSGHIEVRGAKNLVPKAMVASLLSEAPSVLSNVPEIADTHIVTNLVQAYGAGVKLEGGRWHVTPGDLHHAEPSAVARWAGTSRIPILFAGPLLHRLGEAFLPALGGCAIGSRPVDFHLEMLRQFGATVEEREDGVHLHADQLHGIKTRLPYPSVGATEQAILTAVLAKGRTEISNAAVEPEILELLSILQRMGAQLRVRSDRVLEIVGVDRLDGFHHHAMPDRLEIASWAVAALITGGEITTPAAHQPHLFAFLDVFRRMGGGFDVSTVGVMRFWRAAEHIRPVVLETDVHPGLMTDWQSPLTVALTQARGASVVHETVYEDRLGHLGILTEKMGAHVQLMSACLGTQECRFAQQNFSHSAIISGPTPLRGAELLVPNLRAGFSYVLAALVAEGESKLAGADVIERGYEDFPAKLTTLGADFDLA